MGKEINEHIETLEVNTEFGRRELRKEQEDIYISTGKDNTLEVDVIKDIISKHYEKQVPRLLRLYEMYKGNHDILSKPLESNPLKPDNRLINGFPSLIVDTAVGYFLGKPIVINLKKADKEDKDMLGRLEKISEELKWIQLNNDFDDLMMEVGKEASIKGRSSILVYQDEIGDTKLMRVPAEECIFVYDSSLTDECQYAIRVYDIETINEDETIKIAEVYDKEKVTFYREYEGEFVLDEQRPVNPVPHIFGDIPLVEIINNEERLGDFEREITLINAYDKTLSNLMNEVETYRNAYLILKNQILTEDMLFALQGGGNIFEIGENAEVKFLTKDAPSIDIENSLDRIEQNIHKFSQIPDLSDEKFGSNLSGIAIRFKLFGLENKCIIKERKMTKAIYQLIRLMAIPLKVRTGELLDIRDIQIHFTRNLPVNIVEIVSTVKNLLGVVDRETLLSLLPFIDDPQLVIEKLQKEEDDYLKEMDKYGVEDALGYDTLDLDSLLGSGFDE